MAKIKDKIKVGDKEIDWREEPEILLLVEAVRKEEKGKLYSQIQTLEADKKVLEDEKRANGTLSTEQKAELERIKGELAVAKAAKENHEAELAKLKGKKGAAAKSDDDDDDDDDDGTPKKKGKKSGGLTADDIRELLAEERKSLKEELLGEVDKKVGSVSTQLTAKEVEDYRKEQLEKYEDVVLEDFVPENLATKDEVNAAIQKAIAKSKKYIKKEYTPAGGKKGQYTLEEIEGYEAAKRKGAGKKGADAEEEEETDDDNEERAQGGGEATPTYKAPGAKKPPASGGDVSSKQLLKNVADMNDDEYAKHRDKILREARNVKYEPEAEDKE